MNMKHLIFTISVIILSYGSQLLALDVGISKFSGQSTADSAAILQIIVDLPQLQQYYPLNEDNSTKPLVVMQHGVSFDTGITATHNNQALVFKSKADIVNESAYFLFWTFAINGSTARIEFSYNYNMDTPSPASQKVILTMEKSSNNWTITNIETIQLWERLITYISPF